MFNFAFRNIVVRFGSMPMLPLTLALICGIVASAHFAVHWAVWLALCGVTLVFARWYRVVVLAALFAFGGFIYSIHSFDYLPHNQRLRLIVEVTDEGIDYGRFSTCAANVLMCQGDICRARVRLTTDSLTLLRQGDVVEFYGRVRPFKPVGSDYARSMARQGYSGRVTVHRGAIVSHTPAPTKSLHSRAVERLKGLTPQSAGRDVALSVTLGTRTISGTELAKEYSFSGASHLLAVSGLHVGLVFVLLNMLLFPLAYLWRGNIIRAVAVVAMVWVYVALCGYPTSAIRAAIMFSVLQLSYIAKSRHLPENSLCATAFIMLAFDPYMLFELSFELSFVAVMAILFIARPIISAVHCRGFVGGIVDALAISTACVVSTAPLVSNSFGVVSLLSIVVTPLALVTSQVIIVCNIAALVLPEAVARITAQSAAWCGTVQNSIVEWFVSTGFGYAEYRVDNSVMTLCYTLLALLVLLSLGIRWEKRK